MSTKTKTRMKVKDLSATFHLPPKLQPMFDSEKKEIAQQLPPFNAMPAFPVDMYPACPKTWMHGSDMASSYFVPVVEEQGLWIDFNACEKFGYDVAIVVSVQGINPITGQKTDKLRLEQYKKKCPIHDVPFKQERFCPKCGFKWPAQNYITTTSTPEGYLWIDGFRNPNGTVRQYIFTEKEMQGIAQQLIGKDKVYAIGIAFYISKKKKQGKQSDSDFDNMLKEVNSASESFYGGAPAYMGPGPGPGQQTAFLGYAGGLSSMHTPNNWGHSSSSASSKSASTNLGDTQSKGTTKGKDVVETSLEAKNIMRAANQLDCLHSQVDNDVTITTHHVLDLQALADLMPEPVRKSVEYTGEISEIDEIQVDTSEMDVEESEVVDATEIKEVDPVKNLEVAAGALIKQKIHEDPKKMDYWEDDPFGMIYVNYCDSETAKKILAQGKIKEKENGFMEGAILATEPSGKEN